MEKEIKSTEEKFKQEVDKQMKGLVTQLMSLEKERDELKIKVAELTAKFDGRFCRIYNRT